METKNKFVSLKNLINSMNRTAIAFSGGTDSTFLAKTAIETLKNDNVVLLTASSETFPCSELKESKKLAKLLNVKHIIIKTEELNDPDFISNPPNRCYFCKKDLFSKIKDFAIKNNFYYIADGYNKDDEKDFRPGHQAALEFEVRSPLAEVGLTKKEIRSLSKNMNLPTWHKPSFACLASRFPYGEKITIEKLKIVDEAESFLKQCGFKNVRVRFHNEKIARIEIDELKIPCFLDSKTRLAVIEKFKKLGFVYITLDLTGYRTGSMNEVIQKSIQNTEASSQKKYE
ncbi:MAG: ATP-dependent sacrificial sulfur transferase LarE [Actinobacteria bacterium]|nr:ATP-dependent sacrificial sulfur transferase LarE [Actinomycetota bacterium]